MESIREDKWREEYIKRQNSLNNIILPKDVVVIIKIKVKGESLFKLGFNSSYIKSEKHEKGISYLVSALRSKLVEIMYGPMPEISQEEKWSPDGL